MTIASSASVQQPSPPRPVDQNLVVLAILALAATAWAVLLLTHGDGGHSTTGHAETELPAATESHPHHGGSAVTDVAPPAFLVDAGLAVGAWTVMVVAMMLPPALPLLQTVRRLVSRRPDPWRLTTLSAMTFVGAWAVVGAVVVLGDLGLRALVATAWSGSDLRWASGAVLIAAGVYQFTPLKDLCLRGCRSPRSFVLAHWQGRHSPGAETVALSGAYALSCIGCCWALMLVCFAVGTAALPVMVALTVVMAAERLVPWGRRLVRPAGLLLILLGTVMILSTSSLIV